jgi:uncharacterized protein
MPLASSPGIVVQTILVFFLIVLAPLWDVYEIRRLKASADPRKKIRFYTKVITASWTCAILACLLIGWRAVYSIHFLPGETSWLAPGTATSIFLKGLIVGASIALMVPAALALFSEKIRAKAKKAGQKLSFLIPSTREERRRWWLVCLTAGICEEVVYRGFLLNYLHTRPFHLTLTWALVVASVIFGIGHLYQGAAGSIAAGVLGFVLGIVFLWTGSLLIPIVAHAIIDLRVLAMIPEGFDQAPA